MSKPVTLTAEQEILSAHPVEHGGPALVVAVAGAGKTESIVATEKTIIRSGVSPQDVLVATFSKPGCENMADRAVRRCVPNGVSHRTLHSCGFGIMGEISNMGAERPGRRDLVLVDPRMRSKGKGGAQAWWVRKLQREYLEQRSEGQDEKTKQAIAKMKGTIFSEIGFASAHLIRPESWTACEKFGSEVFPAYVDWAQEREREPVDAFTADIVQGFYALWEEVKFAPEAHNYDTPDASTRGTGRPLHPSTRTSPRSPRDLVRWVSYDDMLYWPARFILEGKSFMEAFRDTFAWVIVDEAQDNNRAQNTIAEFIADSTEKGPNLILVGDDQQSIYAFRGSQPSLLRSFIERHDARVLNFTANFRCAQGILDVGNGILDHAEDRLYQGGLRLGRTDDAAKGGTVSGTEYEAGSDEARGVIDGIVEAIEHGVSPDDIAILYRLNAQSGALELECIKRGVLYKIEGSKFFNRPEIKATVAFLKLSLNEKDEDAFDRVRRTVRGLGPSFMEKYPTLAKARKLTGKRSTFKPWAAGLSKLIPMIDGVKAALDSDGLGAAIHWLSEDGGLRATFRDDAASEEDETDVDVALRGLAECAENVADVETLLTYAEDQSTTGKSSHGRTSKPRITLSTVHKAKGLEWLYVAAIGWTEGVFPFFRAPADEERRLGYVCATRAKQFLRISWTANNDKGEPAGPSSLVFEGTVEEVASRCLASVWPGTTGEPEVEEVEMDWGTPMGR